MILSIINLLAKGRIKLENLDENCLHAQLLFFVVFFVFVLRGGGGV